MSRYTAITIVTLTLALAVSAGAGTMSDELARQVQSAGSGETIRVWIKLQPVGEIDQVRRSLARRTVSRAERVTTMVEELKNRHSEAQASLREELNRLRLDRRAANIHAHWIANVIDAEIDAAELPRLAARPDVELVMPVPEITMASRPRPGGRATQNPNAIIEPHLTFIHADDVWALGYDGTGRLVCSFDNGVDVSHPALADRWVGQNADSSAGWFDSIDSLAYPHVYSAGRQVGSNIEHGTHVMGLMVAREPTIGDTYGVAPGARWMSAAVIIRGGSILRAFEWVTDPDGNPNTVGDVPDVINHSWSFPSIGCISLLNDIIASIEAMGIVNIFSVGNDGNQGAGSADYPAAVATDSISHFAVGAIDIADSLNPTLPVFSAQGPGCTGGIKPNVVAPGVALTSTWTGGLYRPLSGTSMSAPLVSGTVALMRQKNPNLSVDAIKTILLNTTNRSFFGSLPNNNAGWGILDCLAAVNAVPEEQTQPNIRVFAFTHPPISPGDAVTASITLQNLGDTAVNVSATITEMNPAVNVTQASAAFGTMFTGDTVTSPNQIQFQVSDTVTPGRIIPLDFDISINGSLHRTTVLYIPVGEVPARTIATHNTGRVQFSLSNYGMLGLGDPSFFPAGGAGYVIDGGTQDMWEGGLIVSETALRTSSGVHSEIDEPDYDFSPIPGGDLVFSSPGALADQQTYCRMSDSNSQTPVGVVLTQESFSFTSPDDDFILLRYVVTNTNSTSLNDLRIGLYFDWDPADDFSFSAGDWDDVGEFAWLADNDFVGTIADSAFRCTKLVHGDLSAAFTEEYDLRSALATEGGDGYTTFEKFQDVGAGIFPDSTYEKSRKNLYHVVAAGPLLLAAGESDTVAFAVFGGESLANVRDIAARAQSAYDAIRSATDVDDGDTPSLPERFTLYQNYPNPFNPTTVIAFDLPVAGEYMLTVFNAAGRKVRDIAGSSRAGRVEVPFDGDGLASGVYLYRVTSGDFIASRKMLLLK